jgi:hypothetical protein
MLQNGKLVLQQGKQRTCLHSLVMVQMLHLLHELRFSGDVKIIDSGLHTSFHDRAPVLAIGADAAHQDFGFLAQSDERLHAGHVRFVYRDGRAQRGVARRPCQRCGQLLPGAPGDGDLARRGIGGVGEFEELPQDVLAREAGRAQDDDVDEVLRHGGSVWEMAWVEDGVREGIVVGRWRSRARKVVGDGRPSHKATSNAYNEVLQDV